MGKSPGKWIKTLLFGKKTVRSHASKGRSASKAGNDKGYIVAKGPPASAENSPVISEPVLVSTHSNGINPELEKGKPSSVGGDASLISPTSQGAESQGIAGPGASNNPEKFREEQAAIKAQAAFRGFLARRAFHALKGIIRLQALVRGHLVRRQAVATLRSVLSIVKLQALVRGKKARSSGIGLEVKMKFYQGKTVVATCLDIKKGKLYTNAFVCKLLSSSLIVMPLRMQYDQGEPNSVFGWLERWTISHFWKPPSQPKKTLDSKSQVKRGSYAMETESARTKRTVRRNSAANIDSGPTVVTSEPEKSKRSMRKVSSSAESVQEHPQSELEKVKRNLRKVTSAMTDTSDRLDVESEKQSRSVRKVAESPSDFPEQSEKQSCSVRKVAESPSDFPGQGIDDSAEKKKDVALTPEAKPDMEIASKSLVAESQVVDLLDVHSTVEADTVHNIDEEENVSMMNGDFSSKEEQPCNENQKTGKRRASFSAKSDYTENGVQNTPSLPSYMQATESAKAKLRAQNSPRLGSDSAEKNGITRRHSLPSSTNGKVSSHSPRTQRILQASSKGGIRSDRSLLSSRDGNATEKLIQVEWRR